ncbi:hypothetical protein NL676_022736 [Syzygium grande]|nr:hypothetical protein NL676_022736 [Syzygium grande]
MTVISLWKDAQSIHRLPCGLSTLKVYWIPQLPDFYGFRSLSVVSISYCSMPHFPVLTYLESLRELEIQWCAFLKSTPDLSCLKRLQELTLFFLDKLVEIPGLGEVKSLKSLSINFCDAIERLPNLSKLKNLQHLDISFCRKMRAVEGLKELKFLKKVEIKYTSMEKLSDVPAFTKLKTDSTSQEAAFYEINSTLPEVEEDTIQYRRTSEPRIIPEVQGLPIKARQFRSSKRWGSTVLSKFSGAF